MGRKISQLPKSSLPTRSILAAFTRALQIAEEFEGATSPNPAVGCVLLDAQGNQLAIAAHEKAGGLHAEAAAIEQCRLAGTLEHIYAVVVTLEPCNHTGRTPPCTNAILGTSAREVWIGTKDPNPDVSGNGAEELAANGLRVGFLQDMDDPDANVLASAVRRLIAPFAKHMRTGLPWVTVKQALNSAHSMIPEPGKKTFTSPSSLKLAHRLRKRAGAVLTGSGTILADKPEFTVRHVPDFEGKHRHLVIMDRRKRVPDTYVQAAEQAGFKVMIETSLDEAFARLGKAGVQEVLVEAGPTLLESVLATDYWDEHVTITQGAGTNKDDLISICYRTDLTQTLAGQTLAGREDNVLRDC